MASGDDDLTEGEAQEAQPDPTKLNLETIAALKRAGYPKPEGVSWGQWMGPKKLNHRHEIIAMMAAAGKSATVICAEMGYTDSRMSIILNSPRMQAHVKKIRQEYFGENIQDRFKRMLPKAVDAIEKILDNPQEKSSVRLHAASELMNRAIGKPKETVEIKNNSIRELFEYLDNSRGRQNTLDFKPDSPQPDRRIQAKTIDAVLVQSDEHTAEDRAKIDAWVEDNIPEDQGIGKRKE